ncbi:hypothetical protein [Thiobacillus thioparus]|uniref:hypothetical protein n=1 Tax=Thiobacillus thioparus TaxID=931 RepID=UPI000371855C|nr:hypothetical protein [Thiobacillus thioparus]
MSASTPFAEGITADVLRTFLALWPFISKEAEDAQQMLIEDQDILLGKEVELFAWCHLYELPFKQHIAAVNAGVLVGYAKILQEEDLSGWHRQLADTPGQIAALPDVISQVEHHFDAQELSKADAEEMRPTLAAYLGLALSMYNSLRCVLYHGCFLNELIERVRADNDKALFDAIRVDPTVIGCPSVSNRISKAALLRDDDFFDKLKAAINGTLAKRDQANFQKMRLVLEILHEAGATRLSDAQLHELFVEELKLYSGHAEGGGSAKALRKFCDTYMKKSAITQKPDF